MVGLTLAIGDFMLILVTAMLWTGATVAGGIGLGMLGLVSLVVLARRLRLRRAERSTKSRP